MKLLQVVPYKIYPAHHGGQKGIYYPTRALNKKIQILSLTISTNKGAKEINVDTALPNSIWRYLNPFIIFTIKKRLNSLDTNLLLVEHPFLAWQAAVAKKFLGIKLVVKSHNIEYERFKSLSKKTWPILRWIEKYVHRRADFNFFISEEDRQLAIQEFGLRKEVTEVIPYGVLESAMPTNEELTKAKIAICTECNIPEKTKIFMFNGTFSYLPNVLAIDELLDNILPALEQTLKTDFKVVICGRGLPDKQIARIKHMDNMHYTGFVDDIGIYFKGCDVFINPVIEGGGVKTKLVEALGFGKPVVTYLSGSYGVDPAVTGGRLQIVADYDASHFALVCKIFLEDNDFDDNEMFYKTHNWDQIAKKMVDTMKSKLFS